MKKIEYQAPEMEIYEMKVQQSLLEGSPVGDDTVNQGTGDAEGF